MKINVIIRTSLAVLLAALPCLSQAQENIRVGTSTRNMITYVPRSLPEYNAPLLISLHGMNQDAAYQRDQTKWNAVADTAKFVVVYPNGINKGWDIGGTTDTKFIEAIIDTMYQRYHINRNRVYVSGFSMGGMMTYHCMSKLSNKVAAFAPVSGIPVDNRNPSGPRAVPFIHVHGTADDVVKYNGDPNHGAGGYPGVPSYVERWAKFNGCDATAQTIDPYPASRPNSAAALKRWRNGRDGVEVALLSIDGKGHWHSNDMASAHSSIEIWNFCKRYSLGPEEPIPVRVTSVAPENNSFDLNDSHREFTLTFDKAVLAEGIKAVLTGAGGNITLDVALDGTGKVATLTLPDGVTVADGEHQLVVEGASTADGAQMRTSTTTYYWGYEEVGAAVNIDTLFMAGWDSEQSLVGEGIPTGWKRVNSNADGTKDEKEGGTPNTGGVRLKYFPTPGDITAGVYLSAREYEKCQFYYGSYEGHRLHLKPGKYQLSFSSTYWSEGAYTGGATFNAAMCSQYLYAVKEWTGLTPAGCVYESTGAPVRKSARHVLDFDAKVTADYVLLLSMGQGWNSVIVGNVMFTTRPSVADTYKGGFLRMVIKANEVMADAAGVFGDNLPANCVRLQELLDSYAAFASTSPTEYTRATDAISRQMALAQQTVTAVRAPQTDPDDVMRKEYFTASGQQVSSPQAGLTVEKTYYKDGTASSRTIWRQ